MRRVKHFRHQKYWLTQQLPVIVNWVSVGISSSKYELLMIPAIIYQTSSCAPSFLFCSLLKSLCWRIAVCFVCPLRQILIILSLISRRYYDHTLHSCQPKQFEEEVIRFVYRAVLPEISSVFLSFSKFYRVVRTFIYCSRRGAVSCQSISSRL